MSTRARKTPTLPAPKGPPDTVDVSPAGRPSTQTAVPSPPKKKQSRKQKAVKRELNMDMESDSSSEDDIKVLALMHKLDPSAPPFKLDRHESDIFDQLPPLPGLLLQELNKNDKDAMDEDRQPPEPPVPSQDDPAPPELLRSIGKRPASSITSITSITSSLKKFAKAPRHMDGGSSAHNVAANLVRTKSVYFRRPEADSVPASPEESVPETPDKNAPPTWGGGSLLVLDVPAITGFPDIPAVPDAPGIPDIPAVPDAPDAPDVNAVSFITAPINIAAAILPVPAKPPLHPDSMFGSIRNLFRAADPDLGLAEFDNFGD